MEVKSKTVGLRLVAGVAIAAIIIVAVFASGIQLPSSEVQNNGIHMDTGRLTVLLKDAPAEADEIWVTITDLAVHSIGDGENDGEWISIDFSGAVENLTFNLLQYQNNETLDVADVELTVGSYNKMRMTVVEANATYFSTDEEENEIKEQVPLIVPSGHIDVITKFNITATEDVMVLIDMIPDTVKISHSNNLSPTLKADIFVENKLESNSDD